MAKKDKACWYHKFMYYCIPFVDEDVRKVVEDE